MTYAKWLKTEQEMDVRGFTAKERITAHAGAIACALHDYYDVSNEAIAIWAMELGRSLARMTREANDV